MTDKTQLKQHDQFVVSMTAYLTACKKLHNQSTLSEESSGLLFWSTLGIL